MVAKSNIPTSMAAELLHAMNPYGYKKFCASINKCDSISMEFYRASKWVNYFVLDTALTFKNGKVNPDHVYEIFGKFNGLSAKAVRKKLVELYQWKCEFCERTEFCVFAHAKHGV